jgi:hypothetical protein
MSTEKEGVFDWIKKHSEVVTCLSGLVGLLIWNNSQFSHLKDEIHKIHEEVLVIRTVMIMNKIMPNEISCKNPE